MTGTTPATPSGKDARPNPESGRPRPPARPPRRDSGRSLYWLLPVLALLGGLVLGGVIVAVADTGSRDGPARAASPAPQPTAASTDPGDRTVTVPASCADGLDKADAALQAARDGIDALGNLDGTAARDALDRLVTLRPEIADLADRCRAAATDGS